MRLGSITSRCSTWHERAAEIEPTVRPLSKQGQLQPHCHSLKTQLLHYFVLVYYVDRANGHKSWLAHDVDNIQNTTETGRPRIQRLEWQLIVAPNVNDLGHMALFVKSKSWTHMVTFLSPCWFRRHSLLFAVRSFGVDYFRGSPKYFNWKFSFAIPQWWSLKCFPQSFHVWISRELEFAFCCLQNTPLLNHALKCDHMCSPFSIWQTKLEEEVWWNFYGKELDGGSKFKPSHSPASPSRGSLWMGHIHVHAAYMYSTCANNDK